jgi:hypothetical protein
VPTDAGTVAGVADSSAPELRERRTEVLRRLFDHEIVRPSTPMTGYLCLRADYTHPTYPGLKWPPGAEHEGHFVLSNQPLGALSWLPPDDRPSLRVVECAATPDSIIGGGHDTLEAHKVIVTAELSKPLGAHSDALQGFWASLRRDSRTPDHHTAIELATEALLRFRLYGRFSCRGISFVRDTVNRTGWARSHQGRPDDWSNAWESAVAEIQELRSRSLSDGQWRLFSGAIDTLINSRLLPLPRPELICEHILLTSYALAAGPTAARLNPFAPLVGLALMGLTSLGVVGQWFWISGPPELAGYRHSLSDGFFEPKHSVSLGISCRS